MFFVVFFFRLPIKIYFCIELVTNGFGFFSWKKNVFIFFFFLLETIGEIFRDGYI